MARKSSKEQKAAYKAAHPEQTRKMNSAWYQKNIELCKARASAWAKNNPEKMNARKAITQDLTGQRPSSCPPKRQAGYSKWGVLCAFFVIVISWLWYENEIIRYEARKEITRISTSKMSPKLIGVINEPIHYELFFSFFDKRQVNWVDSEAKPDEYFYILHQECRDWLFWQFTRSHCVIRYLWKLLRQDSFSKEYSSYSGRCSAVVFNADRNETCPGIGIHYQPRTLVIRYMRQLNIGALNDARGFFLPLFHIHEASGSSRQFERVNSNTNGCKSGKNDTGNLKPPTLRRIFVLLLSFASLSVLCTYGWRDYDGNGVHRRRGLFLVLSGAGIGLIGSGLFIATYWPSTWGWWL